MPLRPPVPAALVLGALLGLSGAALGWEAGLPLDALKAIHSATASERAQAEAEREAKAAERAARVPTPRTAHTTRITPPAALPFEAPATALPVIPPGPLVPDEPARVLETACAPYLRIARASPVTGSLLMDAPCLANRRMLALFGDNPSHRFVVGEYGDAEFIFGAPEAQLYPFRLFDRATGLEKVLQETPDGPIFVFSDDPIITTLPEITHTDPYHYSSPEALPYTPVPYGNDATSPVPFADPGPAFAPDPLFPAFAPEFP